jgi:hypothetical protein
MNNLSALEAFLLMIYFPVYRVHVVPIAFEIQLGVKLPEVFYVP